MTNNLPSWFIRAAGILGAVAAAVLSAPDNAPGAKYLKPWAPSAVAMSVAAVGLTARQNNVSSEAAGAIKPSTTPNNEKP